MARPRKAEALDIPRRAVEETIRLLAERDDFELTLAEVASAIGCKPPALYNHFRNKNALLRAAHDEGFARLYQDKLAIAATSEGNAFERLREGGYAYMRFALENPALYRLMFTPPKVAEIDEDPFETDIGRRALDFLLRSIRACQDEGYLPEVDAEQAAFTLWSTVHGAASLVLQHRAPRGGDDSIYAVVDAIMSMISSTRRATHEPLASPATNSAG